MGLATVMQTALSGMNAATAIINVTANNLANAETPGFKASSVQLADSPLQTLSVPSKTSFDSIQIGTGVQVVGVVPDSSQGQDGGSNVNIGHELVELALAGNMFQANLAVFQTANAMLGHVIFASRVQ